jgi:DNA-binding transcriptional ArsR family regulator
MGNIERHVAAPEAALRAPAPVFAVLGDATRLGLVRRLCGAGPQSITRLSEGSGVTRQAVTKHLGVLARVGLVRVHRDGRERIYELETRRLGEAGKYLDQISAQWDEALGRLELLVEGKD